MASEYADTPSRQQAATELPGPVTFTATIVNLAGKYKGASGDYSRIVSPDYGHTVRSISRDYQATFMRSTERHSPASRWASTTLQLISLQGRPYVVDYRRAADAANNPYTGVVSPLCGGGDAPDFDQ
jgi:hypothetical protein